MKLLGRFLANGKVILLGATFCLAGCSAGKFSSQNSENIGDAFLKILSAKTEWDGTDLVGSISIKISKVTGQGIAGITPILTANSVSSFSLNKTVLGCESSDADGLSVCRIKVHSGAGEINLQIKLTNAAADSSATLQKSMMFYAPPSVTSVAPLYMDVGATATLTLSGGGFRSGMLISIAEAPCTEIVIVSSTQANCEFTVPNAVGMKDVKVINADLRSYVRSGAFEFKDVQAPSIAFDSQPSNLSNVIPALFTYTITDSLAPLETLAVSCTVDGAAVPCTRTSASLPTLSDGPHTFEVSATDPSGNQSNLAATWVMDTTPPLATINSSGLGGSPSNSAATRTLSVSGTGVVAYKAALTVTGTCVGSDFTSVVERPVANSYSLLLTTDGSYGVCVIGRDSAGNWQSSPTLSSLLILDTTSPALILTSPAALSSGVSALTVAGTCETGFNVYVSGSGASANSNFPCVGGAFSQSINFSSVDGVKNIILSQTDAAGNSSSINRDFMRESSSTFTWRQLKVGAGGFIVGMDIAADGTKVARADVYGGYFWNGTKWIQLVNSSSMPAADVNTNMVAAGVYELRIAPSNTNRFYMMYLGSLYRSENRGTTWIKTAFANVATDANDDYRQQGQKMAIDPVDANIVYVGTPANGMWVTSNGGNSWTRVVAVPNSLAVNGVYPGYSGIAFDSTFGTASGKTKKIYASSYGNGVYQSTDAGGTWSRLAGGPSNVQHGKVAIDGAYYAVGDGGTKVWRYLSNTWTNVTPVSAQWATLALSPTDAAHVVAMQSGGNINVSIDRGATWGGTNWGSPSYPIQHVATDIPWLGWFKEVFMSAGDVHFDPSVANKLWFADGLGVWHTTIVKDQPYWWGPTWNSMNAGIEELVANQVLSPPGGKPLVASWDKPVFYIDNPEVYPSTFGPDKVNPIVAGWSLDYASSDPTYIAGIFNYWGVERSAYSANGGRNWTLFPTTPAFMSAGKLSGTIAASTPQNIIWLPAADGNPHYTLNGGTTWIQASIPGVPTSGETGWGSQVFLNRQVLTADRVDIGTFYIYNYLSGLYKSTNGGVTWTLVRSGQIAPYSLYNAKIKSVPGKAGHLFFTSGEQDSPGATHPAPTAFVRSTDGGVTWSTLPNVKEVRSFGFGKSLVADGYPTIYIYGWVSNVHGIHRSTDQGATWVKVGDYPLGLLDTVKTISGDMNTFGIVYVGFSGSGYAYLAP